MSFINLLRPNGATGFGARTTAEEVTRGLNLGGRAILVTGVNSGLGRETARVLALRGARVLAAARSQAKAEATCADLAGDSHPLSCELSDPRSIEACVQNVQRLETPLAAIICNAGIMALPRLERVHGYEKQFFTNHIGHFLLVTGLLSSLSPEGRVVIVSSDAHRAAPRGGIQFDNLSGEKGYQSWVAYGQSKLANLLFAKELARRLPEGQTANAIHPGVIQTNLQRSTPPVLRMLMALGDPLFFKSVAEGAATQCFVAVHPAATQTGQYFADCNVRRPRKAARDPELAERLWETSERIATELRRG